MILSPLAATFGTAVTDIMTGEKFTVVRLLTHEDVIYGEYHTVIVEDVLNRLSEHALDLFRLA